MASLLLGIIYLIFVSLGLPDSLLGSGWPQMQAAFNVPSSYAGYVSMTIAFMTIISALMSPKLIQRFHTSWIVVCSILLTIVGLFGFSLCTEYWMLLIFAIPYGLGAGAIDAAMNHYVASYYSGAVMNFLHCFYGLGAVISPYIMALALKTARWNEGYRWTAFLQTGILLVVLCSLLLWHQNEQPDEKQAKAAGAGIKEAIRQRGVITTLLAFFAYCAGEATCFLWTPSYFAGTRNGLSEETIASFGSLIFGGLMLGRLLAGMAANRFGDRLMIRIGAAVELVGVVLVMLPTAGYQIAVVGFVVIGTGMGPIYPSIQHMAPTNFGQRYSAAVIGLQMAAAYTGTTFMPTIFGLLQQQFGIWIMPYYLLVFAVLNIGLLELTYQKLRNQIR